MAKGRDVFCVWAHADLLSRCEFDASFYERAKVNVRANERGVNSIFLVQLRKCEPRVGTEEHCRKSKFPGAAKGAGSAGFRE